MSDALDERLAWMRAAPGRRLEQVIEPVPAGTSVTTRWVEADTVIRQDCHITLDAVPMDGGVTDWKGN